MHAAGSVADLFNLDTTPVQLHTTTFQTGDSTGRGISSYLVRVLIWATRVVSTATNARVAVCLRCGCVLTGGDELSQDRFGDQCPQAVVVCWMGVAAQHHWCFCQCVGAVHEDSADHHHPRRHPQPVHGRQWDPLLDTMPGARRLTGLPSIPVDARFDQSLSVGPSRVPMGGVRDAVVLMPLSDPQQPTRVAVHAQSDVLVRQLIRRSAAAGEVVAVYDQTGAPCC